MDTTNEASAANMPPDLPEEWQKLWRRAVEMLNKNFRLIAVNDSETERDAA